MPLILLCVGADSQAHQQVLHYDFHLKNWSHGLDEALHVANGYSHQVLLRWGDPLFENVAEFDAFKQTAISQRQQFGYNNDFVAYMPLAHAGNSSKHGLLVVNHEFVNSAMMHPGSPHAKKLSK